MARHSPKLGRGGRLWWARRCWKTSGPVGYCVFVDFFISLSFKVTNTYFKYLKTGKRDKKSPRDLTLLGGGVGTVRWEGSGYSVSQAVEHPARNGRPHARAGSSQDLPGERGAPSPH